MFNKWYFNFSLLVCSVPLFAIIVLLFGLFLVLRFLPRLPPRKIKHMVSFIVVSYCLFLLFCSISRSHHPLWFYDSSISPPHWPPFSVQTHPCPISRAAIFTLPNSLISHDPVTLPSPRAALHFQKQRKHLPSKQTHAWQRQCKQQTTRDHVNTTTRARDVMTPWPEVKCQVHLTVDPRSNVKCT